MACWPFTDAAAAGPGQVGLFFDGSGVVRILEVRVVPLARP